MERDLEHRKDQLKVRGWAREGGVGALHSFICSFRHAVERGPAPRRDQLKAWGLPSKSNGSLVGNICQWGASIQANAVKWALA